VEGRGARNNVVRRRKRAGCQFHYDDFPTREEFMRYMRMSPNAFECLANTLHPDLEIDPDTWERMKSQSPMTVHTKLAIALRYFAGAEIADLTERYAIQKSTAYGLIWTVVDAINGRLQNIKFPSTRFEQSQAASEFEHHANSFLPGCISVIDGIAIEIQKPGEDEVSRPGLAYNRKGYWAIQATATCDARARFTFFSAESMGSTHDYSAFCITELAKRCDEGLVAPGFWIAGDEAYVNCDYLLTPWPGQNLPPDKDSFNYNLSCIRQTIERAFGQLIRRFGVLWKPLRCAFHRHAFLLRALAHLHNYIKDNDEEQEDPGEFIDAGEADVARFRQLGSMSHATSQSTKWQTESQAPNSQREALRQQLTRQNLPPRRMGHS